MIFLIVYHIISLLWGNISDSCISFEIHFIYEIKHPSSRKKSDFGIYGTEQTNVLYNIIEGCAQLLPALLAADKFGLQSFIVFLKGRDAI